MNIRTKWDLSGLYKSDTDPQMAADRQIIQEKTAAFVAKWKPRNDWLTDPLVLKEALDEYNSWIEQYAGGGAEGYYFDLRFSLNQTDPQIKAYQNKIEEFTQRITTEMQFFGLRIARIPKDQQESFLSHPKLQEYKHYLETTFAEAKYLLSEPEEKIMVLKSTAAHSRWTEMVSGFISQEEREVLDGDGRKKKCNFSEIVNLLDHPKMHIRDTAFNAVNEIFEKHVSVGEHEINAIYQNKKVDDEIRGVDRPDRIRHMSDDIDTEVVDVLVSTVEERNEIARRFYDLKARILGVKKLKYHERNVPIVLKNHKVKRYTFEEASTLVHSVFHDLDPAFSSIFERFLSHGQLDVYPATGKRNGAFCAHYIKKLPTYILLNFDNSLDDVLTLAHELGHGINNELMREKQKGIAFSTPTSTAEVASTFMEDFVVDRILQDANSYDRLSLLMKRLQDDVATIFRQIAFYRFEQDLHALYRKSGYVSHKEIGVLFRRHMEAYMGPAVEQSPGCENWWIYVNHFRYFFYVYSYASGLLISKSLQNSVRQNHSFIENVKVFLSAGTSESPQEIFMKLGVDIRDGSFWARGLDEIDRQLNATMELAKELKVIK